MPITVLEHQELIITTKRKKTLVTSVYLMKPENQELHIFHCPDCKTPVIQYSGEIAKIIPGLNPVDLPIVVQCSNSKCKRKYSFISLVEEID